MNKVPNNLINELSPYLLQHAYNPVDWHPWNEETLKKAKDQNKPIFLSIGYSACHWCHVMEHESFDDAEVARMMNDTFINIKVDREERPDIDHIYMTVCQVMNGNGGWPLTVLLTPDLKPFFSGTYFPKESMPNRVGIKDVIKRTQEVWANHYNEILDSADEITEQIKFDRNPGTLNEINETLIKKCFYELAGTFDNTWGGFTKRPKFPIPHYYYFLFKFYNQYQNQEAKDMALFTLRKMRMGGLYDHIGKGFHRYSTDQEWLLPHFEKMLYDQALLTIAYTEAYQVSNDKFYGETATDILEYVSKNLLSPEGGFYSAEDADSEGEEGKFYVWDINEIRKNLIGDVEFFTEVFNFKEKGNYANEATGQFTGKNIPFLNQDYSDLAKKYNLSIEEFKNKVNELRLKLYSIRENRIHPQKDDKILTDWNGMMISAYAIAGRVFNNDEFTDVAKKAYDFIKNNMMTIDRILLHRYRDGKSGINGMIDDYAFVIKGLIELFLTTSDQYYLSEAENLFNIAYNELFDEKKGGFFFASKNADDLIIRKKELYDGATPSGNSVMLENMIRLSSLTNIPEINEIIKKTLRAFEISIAAVPSAYSYSVSSIMTYLNGTREIIITGNNEQEKEEIFNKLQGIYLADTMIINLKNGPGYSPRFANYIDNEFPIKIYHCKNFTCEAPVFKFEELMSKITL